MTNLQQAVNHPIFDKISNYCQENNKECFVVGGYVRDFLLKRKSKDIDILVLGSGIDEMKQLGFLQLILIKTNLRRDYYLSFPTERIIMMYHMIWQI